MQPFCDAEEEDGCFTTVVPLPSEPLPSRDVVWPAVIMLIVLVVALGVFEVWALRNHKDRISSLFQKFFAGRWVLQVLGAIGMGLIAWHLIWGF